MGNPTAGAAVIDRPALDELLAILQDIGFTLRGPRLEEGMAVRYGELGGTADLPAGVVDEQSPGHYRVQRTGSQTLFGYTLTADPLKRDFFPPERHLWSLRLRDGQFEPVPRDEAVPKYAILGARACELHALAIQDRVFGAQAYRDEDYLARRRAAFVIGVNCERAVDTCFCASMGTGPRCSAGFDLALTEFVDGSAHEFLVEVGSDAGRELLARLPSRPATARDLQRAEDIVAGARGQQRRQLDAAAVPALLARNPEHPQWQEVGDRCLACGNCTLACPTCFCSDFVDTADVTASIAERHQHWSSCFNTDFSYTHGGSIRGSTAARYRQWLTHKLSSWVEQFGSSGCVGCGRCITWCPVAIDLTAEVAAIAARDGERATGSAATVERRA